MGVYITYNQYTRSLDSFPPDLIRDIESIREPLEVFTEVSGVGLRCCLNEDGNYLNLILYTKGGDFVTNLGYFNVGDGFVKGKYINSYTVKSLIGVAIVAKIFQKYGIVDDYKVTGTGMYDGEIKDLHTTIETFLINNNLI